MALYSVLGIAKNQRGITKTIYVQELWFLRSAHRLMLVNISVTIHEDILNGFQVTELQSGRHCILFLAFFHERSYANRAIIRTHYVNRFRDNCAINVSLK